MDKFAERLQLAQRLAAYIPSTLARQILQTGLPTPGTPKRLEAATMFTDMSGFTAMSEELASDGPRGAEELNKVLLLTFTGMIDVIRDMGGAVSHFYGDAMSVYFPDEDGTAAKRALACGQIMQKLMKASFQRVGTNRPAEKNAFFSLTMKVGIGYGSCQELVVGSPQTGMEFVLTGSAVDEAAQAEHHAEAGQIIASRTILAQMELSALAQGDFTPLDLPLMFSATEPILQWERYSEEGIERLITAVTPFIPPAIYQRLVLGSQDEFAEHRPVTSLFVQFDYTDDTDSSSAIETTELGRKLQEYYRWACEIVRRFGEQNARVNRILTGDKGNQLHIMFGAPVAPDAPEQAGLCALALQRERPSFIASQRIGMAVGKVFAAPVGSVSRREYTIVGDVVNLSARLMQICEDNAVYCDTVTSERIQQVVEFTPLPPIKVKGKQILITPCRLERDRTMTAELHGYFSHWERPLIGRDDEFKKIANVMSQALQGSGGLITLVGNTGVGKTRLLAAGVKYWLDNGGTGLVGVCHQHTSDLPFGPWRNIWQDFFGLESDMLPEEQAAKVVQHTRRFYPACGDDVGLWADVLDLPIAQAPQLQQLTAQVRQARLFHIIRRCIEAATHTQPLLFIFEDVHWADQASLALIDELSETIAESALLIAITFRTQNEFTLKSLQSPACHSLVLGDLSPEQGRRMLKELLGLPDLPLVLEQHLGLRDREGRESPVSPLFLEEAVHVMLEAGVIEVNGRTIIHEHLLTQMQVPDTIHGLLLARLDRLPPTNRDLLQLASVIGRQFTLESLQTLNPLVSRLHIVDLLRELTEEEITQLVTADPEWTYLFHHAMTHEVAYESLPYGRRQTIHESVADWLVKRYSDNLKPLYAILAYHYTHANSHEKGLLYALKGADAARDIFANREAVDLYNTAESHLQVLGVEKNWATAVALFLARGDVLRYVGNFDGGIADGEKALSLALAQPDALSIVRAYNLMADLKYRQAKFGECKEIAQKAIDGWEKRTPATEISRSYHWLGMASGVLGNYEFALTCLQKAESLSIQTNNNRQLALVLEGMAFIYYSQKKLPLALSAMQRSVDLSRNFNIPTNTASALNNIALVQYQLGQAEDALITYDQAIALVREASRNFLARFLTNKAATLTYLGRFIEAEICFQEAETLLTSMDDQYGLVELYLLRGYEHYSALGQWEMALQELEKAQRLILLQANNYPEEQVRLFIGLGQLKLYTNVLSVAEEYLQKALQIINEKVFNWWRPVALYFKGLTQLKAGNFQGALNDFLDGQEAIMNDDGCPDYLPLIYLQLALLANDQKEKMALLEKCFQSLKTRIRYIDKKTSLPIIGNLFLVESSQEYQALGQECFDLIKQL